MQCNLWFGSATLREKIFAEFHFAVEAISKVSRNLISGDTGLDAELCRRDHGHLKIQALTTGKSPPELKADLKKRINNTYPVTYLYSQ